MRYYMHRFIAAALLLLMSGCATFGATQVAEFRHPVTGEIKLCIHGDKVENVITAVLISPGLAGSTAATYAACKSQLEKEGYVRVPVDPQVQAEIDRYDAARADSIRKH